MPWRRLIDAVLLVAAFVFSASVGHDLLLERESNQFGDALKPAAMIACGRGLSVPALTSPEFVAFSLRQRPTLSCEELIGRGTPGPAGAFTEGYRYAIYAIGAAMRVGGLSWRALDIYSALLFGSSIALAYALLRQVLAIPLAAVGVVALVCSNHILGLGLDIRDYGKAPWFFALWLILAWLLRRGGRKASTALLVPAAVAGAVLGIGIGFRIDLGIFAPVFAGSALFAIPGWTRPSLFAKATAAAVFIGAFGLVGAPIIATLSGGSNSTHVVLLGLTTTFTDALGVEPGPYDVGSLYADGYVNSEIAAYAQLVEHDDNPAPLGSARYDRQGSALLADLARHFPADLIVRALGATRQVLVYPFEEASRAEARELDALDGSRLLRVLTDWRDRSGAWMEVRALPWIAAALIGAALIDPRLAVVVTGLVFYFCGYSMLQFSRRHTFHLDLIPIGLVLFTIQASLTVLAAAIAAARSGEWRARARAGARRVAEAVLALATVAVVVTGGLTMARWWQQARVVALLQRTLDGPWADIPVSAESFAVVPVEHDETDSVWGPIYAGDPHSWSDAMLLRVTLPAEETETGVGGDRQRRSGYLAVDVGGPSCTMRSLPIAVKYTSIRHTSDFDYTRRFDVPIVAGGLSRLLFPVYAVADVSQFAGLVVSRSGLGCVQRVRRAEPTRSVPLPVLYATLGPAWRAAPLYQRLRATPARPLPTPVVASLAPSLEDTFGDPLPSLPQTAPDIRQWTVFDGVTVTQEVNAYRVQGNRTRWGYQLMSPAIQVPPDGIFLLRVQGRVTSGRVCVGILEGSQQHFLAAPEGRRRQYRARTGKNTRVFLVFGNCGAPVPQGSRFSVESVSYEISR